jgi:hypothetical protein
MVRRFSGSANDADIRIPDKSFFDLVKIGKKTLSNSGHALTLGPGSE